MRRGADGRVQLRSSKGEWFQVRLDMEVRESLCDPSQLVGFLVHMSCTDIGTLPHANCRPFCNKQRRCLAACSSETPRATCSPSRPSPSSRCGLLRAAIAYVASKHL